MNVLVMYAKNFVQQHTMLATPKLIKKFHFGLIILVCNYIIIIIILVKRPTSFNGCLSARSALMPWPSGGRLNSA